jgi:DnaK suppressor protein
LQNVAAEAEMRETTRVISDRDRELRQILEGQRDRILKAIRLTIREGREEGAMEDAEVHDDGDLSAADMQSELEFALLQMQGATLEQIDPALERLDEGRYGFCYDCGTSITASRLRALPFATRCRACEQEREMTATGPRTASWQDAVRLLEMGDDTGVMYESA